MAVTRRVGRTTRRVESRFPDFFLLSGVEWDHWGDTGAAAVSFQSHTLSSQFTSSGLRSDAVSSGLRSDAVSSGLWSDAGDKVPVSSGLRSDAASSRLRSDAVGKAQYVLYLCIVRLWFLVLLKNEIYGSYFWVVSHDPNVDWKEMRPHLGDCYESPAQLRVAGGWKYNERTFQIKFCNEIHLCVKNYHSGSLVTSNWLAKHYLKDVIMKPKMTLLEMQADVLQRFLVSVSVREFQRVSLPKTGTAEMFWGG
uniref:Uncharacterized protein n=1 Tax=Lactuca sativa TaxID=4236 RepID=A0A9R1UTA4_LACSA|nr:hypothetical protein LSAT_V11C800404480 [Lactuca sativa]